MNTNKLSLFIVLFSLSFLFSLSLFISWQESTTMDEQAHIPASYTYVRYLDMRLNPEHPPLIKIFAGIPLLFLDVTFPIESLEWKEGINEQWTLGNRFLHENNAQLITFLSRIPIIFVSLLFGWFLYLWTKRLAGVWAGTFAVILYAFNPNIIAHSHYVTTDIGIATAIFIALYFGVRFVQNPSKENIVLFGFVLGIAQLVKFSAVLLYPFFGIITLIYALSLTPLQNTFLKTCSLAIQSIFRYWSRLFLASLLSLLPIWIIYTFVTWNMPDEALLTLIQTQLTDTGIPGFAKQFVLFLFHLPLLSSLAEYFLGLAMVFVRVTGGNTYYFLGEVSNVANPAYFPTVYLLKETLPVLFSLILACILSLGSLFIAFQKNKGHLRKWLSFLANSIQKRIALLSMILFVLLYSYLSISSNLNIGFRHLFPIIPFFFLFGALALNALLHIKKGQFVIRIGVFGALLWAILIPLIHYPSYLSYYNELTGGPKNGYLYVTDSNYDWGQDLRNLQKWVENHNKNCTIIPKKRPCNPIEKIRIDYFGGSSPEYWFGDMFIPWRSTYDPEPGWYAISATFLQESVYKKKEDGEKSYEWTTQYKPIGRAGDSIFIYYVPNTNSL